MRKTRIQTKNIFINLKIVLIFNFLLFNHEFISNRNYKIEKFIMIRLYNKPNFLTKPKKYSKIIIIYLFCFIFCLFSRFLANMGQKTSKIKESPSSLFKQSSFSQISPNLTPEIKKQNIKFLIILEKIKCKHLSQVST